ncbi:hypothetical protein AVEN_79645-1 [Araneus ventricosus]|uniref:Uncharacterized protein n=1 Tax=Araneus ventricosus TaxID=182803 RepID=A0A4Y2K4I3_ARAVE|nr:hypothetical protein AVEN_79645-1 [Araneus ventricosus]
MSNEVGRPTDKEINKRRNSHLLRSTKKPPKQEFINSASSPAGWDNGDTGRNIHRIIPKVKQHHSRGNDQRFYSPQVIDPSNHTSKDPIYYQQADAVVEK